MHDQGSNPCALHWEDGVLTSGPMGKFLISLLVSELLRWLPSAPSSTTDLIVETEQYLLTLHHSWEGCVL